jgi:hypothetical protein
MATMIARFGTTALFLGSAATIAGAQDVEWIVRDSAVVAADSGAAQIEPHVAVNPMDPLHVVVGAIVAGPDRQLGPWHCSVYTTPDGGRQWSSHAFPIDRCIDPWLVFTDSATVLFAATEITRQGEGDDRFRLALYRSEDGGGTWAEGPALGRTHEHAQMLQVGDGGPLMLVSRRTAGPAEDRRHVIWLARSRDAGRSFDTVVEHDPGGVDVMVTGIAVVRAGTVLTYRRRDVAGGEEEAWSLLVRSDGRGSQPLRIDTCTSGAERDFAGYPVASGSDDLIVHACVGPNLEGVRVTRSTDGGESWSDAVRADGGGPSPHARTPMLAVSGSHVVVAWYDRRHDVDRACQDVYLAVSHDRGATFAAPLRVTTGTSCPGNPANATVARSWPMGGDYGALTPTMPGTFRLVWADARAGLFRLRTAVFRVAVP